ncbi:Flotillin-2a, partial [Fragariocoptes setiger]
MGNINTVGPNEALIVSGGCFRASSKRIIVGGWCWSCWMVTNIQRMSLQIMTIKPECKDVETVHGVPISVTGVVHCKIMSQSDSLPRAAEQFLGKTIQEIKSVVLTTVQGHMRAVIGTQTVDDIYTKRQVFASLVREAATGELNYMGIDILSLTIGEISDKVEYLSSLSQKSTAKVKSEAATKVARAESEAAQQEGENNKNIAKASYEKDKEVAQAEHEAAMKSATYDNEVSTKKAEATMAYDLQVAKTQKDIRREELNTELAEIEGQLKIDELEVERQKKMLAIEIELPADADAYVLSKESESIQFEEKLKGEAEAHAAQIIGEAEADAMKITGNAEAESMKLVAESYKEFQEAAILSQALEALPKIAAELAAPLAKIEEMVLISGGQDNANAADEAKSASAVPRAITTAVGKAETFNNDIMKNLLQLQTTARAK